MQNAFLNGLLRTRNKNDRGFQVLILKSNVLIVEWLFEQRNKWESKIPSILNKYLFQCKDQDYQNRLEKFRLFEMTNNFQMRIKNLKIFQRLSLNLFNKCHSKITYIYKMLGISKMNLKDLKAAQSLHKLKRFSKFLHQVDNSN